MHRFRKRKARLGFEPLEVRCLLAVDLRISEFMARNDGVLADEDGEFSDWLELHNQGATPVDLDGYYLTDDAGNLAKWQFPAHTLGADDYLLVFASGKNRMVAGAELHTSFSLNGDGEYLALVEPDGTTVAHQYSPAFPAQFDDVSFGLSGDVTETALVSPGDAGRVLVPTISADLPADWADSSLDDSSWTPATTGVGFDTGSGGASIHVLAVDFNDDDAGEAGDNNTEDGFETMTLADNGKAFAGGVSVTLSVLGGATLDDRDRSTPNENPPDLTLDQLYDDFIFAGGTFDGAGVEIVIEGLAPNQNYALTVWSFDSGSTGGRVSDWIETAGGSEVEIATGYTFDGAVLPAADNSSTFGVTLTSSPSGQLRIEGRRMGGTSHGVFLNALRLEQLGFSQLIQTDLEAEMLGQNASAFLRIPFDVADPAAFDRLTIRMQYDDGFIAYLNGQPVAGGNDPAAPQWNSTATAERANQDAVDFADFDLTSHLDKLLTGANVLAIHGMNVQADDGEFLIVPELIGASVAGVQPFYFESPTPGAANGQGILGFVADTKFDVDRGFYDQPFDVTITTATPSAVIRYTTDGSQPTETNGATYSGPIHVDSTTLLRAVAFRDGFRPSNVDTQTYLFLDDVLTQPNNPGPEFPATWTSSSGVYTADYEVDQGIVNSRIYSERIRDDLKSIPTMSIVMNHDDLWGASTGIYNHAESRGEAWRRGASVEYFDPNTGDEFQVNAGIQIHGGASRDNARLLKHSFRLLFRNDFGPGELRYPLFDDTSVDEFNTLVLRAFFTDSFATRTAQGRYSALDSQYLRDVWMKDSQLAMGSPSAHGTYVHLYINGLYWGLYNPSERPDDAFLAEHLGGEREDYDIVKDFNELSAGNRTAWNAMFAIANAGLTSNGAYQRIQGNDPDGSPNPNLPNYLDVDNLIDYMILHFYGGAEDWPHHNWYAARDRVGETKGFQFFVWDQEIVLDGRFRDRTEVSNDFTPARLYSRLRDNAEFRLRFADRVQMHMFGGGALSVEASQQRWMQRANEIEAAIVGESARWGDAREGIVGDGGQIVPTMTLSHWSAERDNVRDNYFPQAHAVTLQRFIDDGLYPAVDAPSFNQHGGEVPAGFEVAISAPAGTVYYTLDGTDPRAPIDSSLTTLLESAAPAAALVPTDGSLGDTWTGGQPFDDSAWNTGATGVGYDLASTYDNLIGIDVQNEMRRTNGSVFIRVPFEVSDLESIRGLSLRMKYDDGFIAYINGVRVAAANDPAMPLWNSTADDSHPDVEALVFQQFDASAGVAALRAGANILAIQGLNVTTASSDMLIMPELLADTGLPPVTAGAIEYTGPFALSGNTQVKARALVGNLWSALADALFTVASPLRITEIMYHPADPSPAEIAAGFNNDDDFEFIELTNTGPLAVDLADVRFTAGIAFDFATSTLSSLAPGESLVLVSNQPAFLVRYGAQINIAGQYTGRLDNGGEPLLFLGALDAVIHDFRYDDDWYPTTDGDGRSLVIVDSQAALDAWSEQAGWRASAALGGSPGEVDPPPLPGDTNNDGVVNIDDLNNVRNHFGGAGLGDTDGDGDVDIDDLNNVRNHFGQTLGGAALVELLGTNAEDPHELSSPLLIRRSRSLASRFSTARIGGRAADDHATANNGDPTVELVVEKTTPEPTAERLVRRAVRRRSHRRPEEADMIWDAALASVGEEFDEISHAARADLRLSGNG